MQRDLVRDYRPYEALIIFDLRFILLKTDFQILRLYKKSDK